MCDTFDWTLECLWAVNFCQLTTFVPLMAGASRGVGAVGSGFHARRRLCSGRRGWSDLGSVTGLAVCRCPP